MTGENLSITCRIILVKPPAGVMFGLQKGSGNNYEVVQKQVSGVDNLVFSFDVTIKGNRQKNPLPGFSAPFVQGPAAGKFVYIDIGKYAGQLNSEWARRLKVPLTGITWDDIELAVRNGILQTSVPGTGKDGGPNCATVKPFDGWEVSKTPL